MIDLITINIKSNIALTYAFVNYLFILILFVLHYKLKYQIENKLGEKI